MNKILKLLLSSFMVSALVLLHISISYLLPYPLNTINILFIAFVLLIVARESGLVVWIAFASYFFIELYTTTPYGVTLFSASISILLGFWIYQILFTNRSWYATLLLCMVSISLFRLVYTILLFILSVFGVVEVASWINLFYVYIWEIILSSVIITIIAFFIFTNSRAKLVLGYERESGKKYFSPSGY